MLEYWRMKMCGIYIFYKNKYHHCDDVSINEKLFDKSKTMETPEDILPFLVFICGRLKLTFEDFIIKFPDDGYVLDEKYSLHFGYRQMSRQYKLGPSRDNLRIDTGNINVGKYLNLTLEVTFSPPEKLFDFKDNKDYIFDKFLACRKTSKWTKTLLFLNTPMIKLKRNKSSITLTNIYDVKLPKHILKVFGNQMSEKKIDAPTLKDFKTIPDIKIKGRDKLTYYSWTIVLTLDEIYHANDFSIYIISKDHLIFQYKGNTYDVCNSTDLTMITDHFSSSKHLTNDVKIIYKHLGELQI